MSNINVHKVQTDPDGGMVVVPVIGRHTEVASFTDGEEISASVKILGLLDFLDNGEAIVITVNKF